MGCIVLQHGRCSGIAIPQWPCKALEVTDWRRRCISGSVRVQVVDKVDYAGEKITIMDKTNSNSDGTY